MMVMSFIEDIVLLMLVSFKALLMSIFKWGSIYSKKIKSNAIQIKRKLTMSIHVIITNTET